jgi:hypothetical protein
MALAHAPKVPEVLGGGHGNFSDTYIHPQNGQTYPMYRFQKREACLMELIHKIVDQSWRASPQIEETSGLLKLRTPPISASKIEAETEGGSDYDRQAHQ